MWFSRKFEPFNFCAVVFVVGTSLEGALHAERLVGVGMVVVWLISSVPQGHRDYSGSNVRGGRDVSPNEANIYSTMVYKRYIQAVYTANKVILYATYHLLRSFKPEHFVDLALFGRLFTVLLHIQNTANTMLPQVATFKQQLALCKCIACHSKTRN